MTKKLSLDSLRKIISEEVEKATLTETINARYIPKGKYDAEVSFNLTYTQAKRLLDLLSDKDDGLANEFRVELGSIIKKHEAQVAQHQQQDFMSPRPAKDQAKSSPRAPSGRILRWAK